MTLKIEDWEDLIKNEDKEKINSFFQKLLLEISDELQLKPISYEISIEFNEDSDLESLKFCDYGIKRKDDGNNLKLCILKSTKKFIPIILLREAYRLFIPESLYESSHIQFFLYMLVELKLERLSTINEWKRLIRERKTYERFFSGNYDTLIKFFKLQDPDSKESTFPYFFEYIRSKNIPTIDDSVFDLLGIEFLERMKKIMREDDTLETIRVLKELFFLKKSYRALLDYKKLFSEMKENQNISTDLSIRGFSNKVRELSRHSICAPNYKIDWNTLGSSVYMIYFRFHPTLNWNTILNFLNNLPFFLMPRYDALGFSRDVIGYFNIPNNYVRDLKVYFHNLEEIGYFIEVNLYNLVDSNYILNLNYFRAEFENRRFISSNTKNFRKDFVLKSSFKYSRKRIVQNLSLLDFLILDRAKNTSFTGFGFERRESTLSDLKTDLLNEISRQSILLGKLSSILTEIQANNNLKNEIINYLTRNKKFGFFVNKHKIKNIYKLSKLIPELSKTIKTIPNKEKLHDILRSSQFSLNIEDKLILKDKEIIKLVFVDILKLYNNSIKQYQYRLQVLNLLEEYFSICDEMMIIDIDNMIKIIQDPEVSSQIYRLKKQKIEEIYNDAEIREISSVQVENTLEKFSNTNPAVLYPNLINSIPPIFFVQQYILLILKYSPKSMKKVEELGQSVPYVFYHEMKSDKLGHFIYFEFGIPQLDLKERFQVISLIKNLFKNEEIMINRFLHPGIYALYSRKKFYDFIDKSFFYVPSLFNQKLLQTKTIFGDSLKSYNEEGTDLCDFLWSPEKDFLTFYEKVNRRIYLKPEKINVEDIAKLEQFYQDLAKILINQDLYNQIKNENFFSDYIESIKFKPILPKFGLENYYLYLRPIDLNDIDFKLLLINTFQYLKFTSPKHNIISFFIKYIFPKGAPNKSYLNWLILSKRNAAEYCIFSIKKKMFYIDLSNYFREKGFKLNSTNFNLHAQKVVSGFKNTQVKISNIIENDHHGTNLTPLSREFKDLNKIYRLKSLDLKKILSTKRGSKLEEIAIDLASKSLIVPYLKFKNLQLYDDLKIIILDLNNKKIEILIELFKFFNYAEVSIIEGEYFLHSFLDIKRFDLGLFIKIKFPSVEISPFVDTMIKIFEILEIDMYLFLTELYNGKRMIKELYKDLNLDKYNPLLNLNWSELDKKWINNKLFKEGFEPNYNPLF